LPGSNAGTWWRWRCAPTALTPELAARLAALTQAAGRLAPRVAPAAAVA
jgi:hypothetical protein